MSDRVVLRQGEPVIILNDTPKPTIVPRNGATFETHVVNAPVTYVTEVTEVVQPDDPGDLRLLFDNQLI